MSRCFKKFQDGAVEGLQGHSQLKRNFCLCFVAKLCPTLLRYHRLTVARRLLSPWDFPGKNTGVGWHFLLQGNPPNPGTEPASPVSPALAGGFLTTSQQEARKRNGSPLIYKSFVLCRVSEPDLTP